MKNIQKRILLFLIGCMGARTALTYTVKNYGLKYRLLISFILLIPALGFTYIYMNDLRKTGAEVFGQQIWWNDLRPFHALMYFIGSYMVYKGKEEAYWPIAFDTMVGLFSFLNFHFV